MATKVVVDCSTGISTEVELTQAELDVLLYVPPKTVDEIQADLEDAVYNYIDSVAAARRYGTPSTSPTAACMSYISSTNPAWAADAAAFSAWRDSVVAYVITQADLVYQGLRTIPTDTELLAEIQTTLPMIWPT